MVLGVGEDRSVTMVAWRVVLITEVDGIHKGEG
jgi:hypothetical protein